MLYKNTCSYHSQTVDLLDAELNIRTKDQHLKYMQSSQNVTRKAFGEHRPPPKISITSVRHWLI